MDAVMGIVCRALCTVLLRRHDEKVGALALSYEVDAMWLRVSCSRHDERWNIYAVPCFVNEHFLFSTQSLVKMYVEEMKHVNSISGRGIKSNAMDMIEEKFATRTSHMNQACNSSRLYAQKANSCSPTTSPVS